MNYNNRLQNVSVLGAAGKMGSGIVLLTLLEMAKLSFKPENKDKTYILNAIDVSDSALNGLINYLRTQILRAAEKTTVQLRELYKERKDLIENQDVIDQYINDVLLILRPTTNMNAAYKSLMVFEAVSENPDLKVKLYSDIKTNNEQAWFFTNTSSIPINELDEKANLDGRIIGFHFYNPPAIQKLVELIVAESTEKGLIEFAKTYAKNIGKIIVPSRDIAGFIGNGHFMRDAIYAIDEVEKLSPDLSLPEAIYTINRVSQDFLIRPMGIFQLIDYVGLDVCVYIMSVMDSRFGNEDIHSSFLDKLVGMGIKGGQFANGSQKDGILRYEKGKISGIYNPEIGDYVDLSGIDKKAYEYLGPLPESHIAWKEIIRNPFRDGDIRSYYLELRSMNNNGATLAIEYAKKSKQIGEQLVEKTVAHNADDVNKVLLTGFYHAYGPINDYI